MTSDFEKLAQADKDHVLHPFTVLKDYSEGKTGDPRILTGGKGMNIQDYNGKNLIDAFAGLYCMNIGYGREEVADAIYKQAKDLAYCHTYAQQSNEPIIRLSERICKMAPGNMERIFYGMSGSDANETQVKLVWYYHNVIGKPEKKKIISRERGYHGSSIISGSLTGLPIYHTLFDQPTKPILHTGSPHYYHNAKPGETELEFSKRRAQELEDMILAEGPDTIGGFIAEPVLGTGGITPPPEGYWEAIQPVLKKYDILLICDEVITGFGRTGEMFGATKYNIEPDLITIAKGLTSAYVPLSGAIVSKKVSDVLKQGSDVAGMFPHGYTYTGHPLGAAAANAVLDIVEREDLPGNSRDVGGYLQQRMQETFAQNPLVGEVRGVGMMAAIEFVANRDTKECFDKTLKVGARISNACLEEGMIARAMPHGDILGFSPPLCITKEDVDTVVGKAKTAIDRVSDELIREKVWDAA